MAAAGRGRRHGGGGTGGSTSAGQTEATCAAICEAGLEAECEGVEPDCASGCEEERQRTSAIGCSDGFEAFLACAAAAPDICNTEGCDTEEQAYAECVLEACSASPTPPECEPSSTGGTGGAGGGA